jgi:hypothetical protein
MAVPMTVAGAFVAGIGAVHGPMAAAQVNDLLLLWRRAGTPAAFLAKEGQTVAAVIEWDGRVYAVMRAGADVRLVALPGE